MAAVSEDTRERRNRRLTHQLLGMAVGAFAFGFALIPLYDVLCEVTGVGNPKDLLKASTVTVETPDENRLVTVEFIAELPMTTTGKVQRRVLRLQEEARDEKSGEP
jgi:cytochrome c oxidase assembly protein subunit 11